MSERSEIRSLFNQEQSDNPQETVECLGIVFADDEARREHFLTLLREGLKELQANLGGVRFTTVEDAVERMKSVEKWPMGEEERLNELAGRMRHADANKDLLQRWKDEVGFPHGTIEDILNLSDPPYYTACPNPFIADFIKYYGKPYDPSQPYHREPFAADVSEGKNDPIYNAHSYHTKVPHKAIMRYILHYTEPGDVVFDGFAGTGMTGVAAQLCGDRKTVESLGYKVDDQGVIYQQETDETGKAVWNPFSKLGARHAVLNDLSPAATFIAYNYNTPVDVHAFEHEAKRILKEVEEECGWMYDTLAYKVSDSNLPALREDKIEALAAQLRRATTANEARAIIQQLESENQRNENAQLLVGKINYTVWSDVFVCPTCTQEVIFWEAAVDKQAGKVNKAFDCPHCGTILTKHNMDRAWATRYDKAIGQTNRQAKQIPVLINYSVGKKRFEKVPDAFDLALIEKIKELDIPYWFPTNRMPEGEESRRNDDIGLTHVHHFYTKRNLWVLDAFVFRAYQTQARELWFVTACTEGSSVLNRERPFGLPSKLSGTLYVSSLIREINVLPFLLRKIEKYETRGLGPHVLMSSDSLTMFSQPNLSTDYIFTDPPFGGNLMYSELNFLWEAWLKVFTNNKPEAVVNKVQEKGLLEYQHLMTESFKEYYRVLKPGRWMTVEFHNSQNSVWNAIQEALQTAGFVIADVRTLDKQQGSFKQVTSASAVKQDLIISAYKPNSGLEERFKLESGTEEGAWDFARTHLRQLPVVVPSGPKSVAQDAQDAGQETLSIDQHLEIIVERQNYLLFDRMVAFHVQHGVTVPLSAAEFYAGLAQRFPERDGMYFLPEQVTEYDQKRMKMKGILQPELFVMDESSAIQWLKQQLLRKPQTFQELHPQFLREISGWQKHEKTIELKELLEQNFLCYDGKGPIPKQIVSWMKQSEKLRKIIQEELSGSRATESNQGLETKNQDFLHAAKDRWYVPDPNKASDLEKLRERALLREFEEYRKSKQRRLKVFRLEAVRAGFKKAWQERDYATIIAVANKIPESVLQEDPKLLMWYDQALTRMGEER